MRQLVHNFILFTFLISASPGFASGSPVDFCQDAEARWKELNAKPPTSTTRAGDIAAWHREKDTISTCLAKKTFSDFLILNQKITYREQITDTLDQSIFLTALQKEAVDQTLDFFKNSGSPEALNFRGAILERTRNRGIGFSLTESSAAIEDRPAGFIRAQRHIIMNYAVMTRDDWLFLFIHEFSHFIDLNLEHAVLDAAKFSNEHAEFLPKLMQKLKAQPELSEFTAEENQNIDLYLNLSLQRGWIAEIRAWASTLEVYSGLKSAGKMGSVEWAEQMISEKNEDETWMAFFSHYLSSRFTYPNNAIYRDPALRTRSEAIEREILKSLE